MPENVTEIIVVAVKKAKVSHLLLVALASGEVRMYREAFLVHSFSIEAPVHAFRFGAYGREDNTLIAVHGWGALTIKIWRRTADVESMLTQVGPPPEQDVPIPVPKKTKLYLEQAQREREQAPDIHRAFQRDLCRLRLETAKAYVKTLTSTEMVSRPRPSPTSSPSSSPFGLGGVREARFSVSLPLSPSFP
jgi:Bardet-Biedl syndrome 1 protein